MKVINILTDSYDVFIDFLLKKMSINNINYLAIDYDKYTELHLSDNIYRIYDKKHIDLNKTYIYFQIILNLLKIYLTQNLLMLKVILLI